MLNFGEGLVRLATDIGAERETRRADAKARSKRVAGLHEDIHHVIAGFDDARVVMAAKIARDAHVLRKELAAANRARVSSVSRRLAEINRERMVERRALAKSAKTLHGELHEARRQLTMNVDAFRAGLVADQASAAETLRTGLSDFVDLMRAETTDLLDAVKEQTAIARGSWNVEKADTSARQPAARGRKTAAKGRSRNAA
jgi:hypothetical protein